MASTRPCQDEGSLDSWSEPRPDLWHDCGNLNPQWCHNEANRVLRRHDHRLAPQADHRHAARGDGGPRSRASRRTAFRKLKDLDARTSYSHRGSYYTLDALADFDEHGLWSFNGVRFSRAGTLLATAESFVNRAEAGHFVDELDNLLGVGTQDPLRKLVGDGRLTRHKLAGQFLYCAADRAHQTHQLRARRLLLATPGLVRPLPEADLMPEELRAAIVLFASLLDERQRRLFAGLEALKCGWGGDRRIAELLGIDPSTVAAGRRQLVARDVELDRVRRAGGGRPPTEKKRRKSSPTSKR